MTTGDGVTGSKVRALLTQRVVDHVRRLGPDRAALLDEADAITALRDVDGMDWISLEDHMAACVALHEVAGDEGYRQAWRAASARALELPLFKPVLREASRMFGGGPGGVLHMTGYVFPLVMRGCGTWRVVPDSQPEIVEFEHSRIPASLWRHPSWTLGVEGALAFVGEVFDLDPRVETEVTPGERCAYYTVSW